MKTTNTKEDSKHFIEELTILLQQAGFSVPPSVGNRLPVEWSRRPLCQICGGSILYRDMVDSETELTSELKADSLHEPYKLLADFNSAVLAGIPSKYGAQFVTWQWSHDRASLWQGHFYGNNYAGAKQDFAIRAGLIEKNHLFSDEQLVEVYRCIHETLESG